MEDSAEGAGSDDINGRLANRRRGKGTGNPGKPGKKLRLADLQSQFGVGLKVSTCLLPLCLLLCQLHTQLFTSVQLADIQSQFETGLKLCSCSLQSCAIT